MSISRRNLLLGGALLAGTTVSKKAKAAPPQPQPATTPPALARNLPYTPVVTPNGATLPWKMVNGAKQFHLVAEPIKREFAPGMVINCWGYNGQSPGPTIEAVEGDRVRLLVTNRLPENTSVHWHGIILPSGMDGVAGLTQPAIQPGETYAYEFTLRQHGTFMYHPHSDEMVQMAMGMEGFFVVHPKSGRERRVDRDFCIFLQEWFVAPGTYTPNPSVMTDFNLFTFNSRIFPGTEPLIVRQGQRVRVRLANLSMDSHPIHFHGHTFMTTGTEGGPIAPPAQWPGNTVNVPPGTTRDIEFVADNPGDWPLHCHKNHHVMNQMSHDFPNMIGVAQEQVEGKVRRLLPGYMAMGSNGMGEMGQMNMGGPKNWVPMMAGKGPRGPMEMGGMFTVVKIRPGISSYEDPGWYEQPAGTAAYKVNGP
jgi:FtsP/CotA-like multicopper oxidase with cupredoxin domain